MLSHRINLEMLESHLRCLPQGYLHFDMETYFYDGVAPSHGECAEITASRALAAPKPGMVGCALGHSGAAGVIVERNDIDWVEFAEIAYGVSGEAFGYLFTGDWYVADNTPAGAADRIRTFLTSGVPEGWKNQLCH